jgi:hypothetical protein
MLTSIRIEDFRGFRAFAKSGFSRVNLLIGPNNVGKTRLLEAIELMLTADTVQALWKQPLRRNEVIRSVGAEPSTPAADVRHLFSGHGLSVGAQFLIEGADPSPRRLRVVIRSGGEADKLSIGSSRPRWSDLYIAYSTERDDGGQGLNAAGGLEDPSSPAVILEGSAVRFVTAGAWDEPALVAMWEEMVLTAAERDVVRAVQLVEPAVERVAVAHETFVLRIAGNGERVPIGAMGDGTRRILGLAIQLARAAGGTLLVDEIDTGLHYSIMRPVWRFLIDAARELNVQIFATAHSLDCLQALASACEAQGAASDDVLVHRIERAADTATTYTADELRVAIAQEMEIR